MDPGTTRTAWLVWDVEEARIVEFAHEVNEIVLKRLRCDEFVDVERMAIECVQSYGMAVGQEVFDTCIWTGRMIEAWQSVKADDPPSWAAVFRKDVKLGLCGSYRAKDGNIRQALIDRVGPVGKKASPGPCFGVSGDVWSALAVALTYADTSESIADGPGPVANGSACAKP